MAGSAVGYTASVIDGIDRIHAAGQTSEDDHYYIAQL